MTAEFYPYLRLRQAKQHAKIASTVHIAADDFSNRHKKNSRRVFSTAGAQFINNFFTPFRRSLALTVVGIDH